MKIQVHARVRDEIRISSLTLRKGLIAEMRSHLRMTAGYVGERPLAGNSGTGPNIRNGRIVFSNGSRGEALLGCRRLGMPVFSARSNGHVVGVFQHWVMDCSSSLEADRIGSIIGRGDQTWIFLPGWISRWKRRTSVFWTVKVRLFTRLRRLRPLRRFQMSWGRR